jgi:hypothetical protein
MELMAWAVRMHKATANYALQRTVVAAARGALRRVGYFAPPRAVSGWRAVAERGR